MSILFMYNYGLVDLDDFDEDDICTVSVAKALSRINRFAGNFESMTVAQHALLVSKLIATMGGTVEQQMAGLHHDDCEAFIGDVPSPIKAHCPVLMEMEDTINDAIGEAYGVDIHDDLVKQADAIIGVRELHFHMDRNPLMARVTVKLPEGYSKYRVSQETLQRWDEGTCLAKYLARHDELMIEILKGYADAPELPEGEDESCLN
jgi:hypothetical protein